MYLVLVAWLVDHLLLSNFEMCDNIYDCVLFYKCCHANAVKGFFNSWVIYLPACVCDFKFNVILDA
jgi:hypothetical protein